MRLLLFACFIMLLALVLTVGIAVEVAYHREEPMKVTVFDTQVAIIETYPQCDTCSQECG